MADGWFCKEKLMADFVESLYLNICVNLTWNFSALTTSCSELKGLDYWTPSWMLGSGFSSDYQSYYLTFYARQEIESGQRLYIVEKHNLNLPGCYFKTFDVKYCREFPNFCFF